MTIVTVFISWKLIFYGLLGLVLQLSYVHLPCVPVSCYYRLSPSSFLLIVPHLNRLCLLLNFIGVCSRRQNQSLWTPSHLLHKWAMRRDQVCPSNNKGGCFSTHLPFAIYKPDPFDGTAHLSPAPSWRLSMSSFHTVVCQAKVEWE